MFLKTTGCHSPLSDVSNQDNFPTRMGQMPLVLPEPTSEVNSAVVGSSGQDPTALSHLKYPLCVFLLSAQSLLLYHRTLLTPSTVSALKHRGVKGLQATLN